MLPSISCGRKKHWVCVLYSWDTERLKWLPWKEVSGKARSQPQLFQRSGRNQTTKTSLLLHLSQIWKRFKPEKVEVEEGSLSCTHMAWRKSRSQAVVSQCLRVHARFCMPLQEERVNCSKQELFQDVGLHLSWLMGDYGTVGRCVPMVTEGCFTQSWSGSWRGAFPMVPYYNFFIQH